jgi:hypothetical protein
MEHVDPPLLSSSSGEQVVVVAPLPIVYVLVLVQQKLSPMKLQKAQLRCWSFSLAWRVSCRAEQTATVRI